MEEDLKLLKLEASNFKRAAFADASKKTYKSQIRSYLKFCLDYGQCPLPASQETLTSYLAYLARKLSASSIPNYLNVVRLIHLQAGFDNPLQDNFEVTMIKKGINREKGIPPIQKLPITVAILRDIYNLLNLTKPADLAFWAACIIGFLGFMRKSTLLPSSATVKPEKMLTRGDVLNLTLDSFSLSIKHSKVIQFGQRVHIIPFSRSPEFKLCPIRSLHAHFGASPLPSKSPLFNFTLAGIEILFSQSCFASRLKDLLSKTGLNPTSYSAHSLRRGGGPP